VVFLDPCKADVQFGQLPPPRHLEYDVTSMGDDLRAAARDWVSERTDYPRHVAQLALAHEADGGGVNVDFDWRPKNNVSNYASAEGTAMSDKSFERHRQGRRRRRVLRAAIGNVTPMSLIGTFETCCDVGSAVAIGRKADISRTTHFGSD
jgi:hypothetical protein